MAIQIQLRQGTTTEHNTFTGAVGEVTVDTTKDTLVVHDGVTVGGHPVAARANADGTISLIKKDGTSAGTINALGLFNNTLTSTNTNQALTAAQGKVLKDALDTTVSSSFGVDQTYSDVTASRAKGVTYTNTTGRAILVNVCVTCTDLDGGLAVMVGGVVVGFSYGQQDNGSGYWQNTITFIVPNLESYVVSGGSVIAFWVELR